MSKKEQAITKSHSQSIADTNQEFNPFTDKLHFAVYRQYFETWWFDNDGDRHQHSTIYAHLRFYENGTIIGNRSLVMPKLETANSYSMKGTWVTERNKIDFELKKTSIADDTINIIISDSEEREMKYYGKIADDNSLIKAGNYIGTICADTIQVGDFLFSKIATSTLIVTAKETACEQLETALLNHPDVIDIFQDNGNWYTNGETGPEWFTVHIIASKERANIMEEIVRQQLKEFGQYTANIFRE